jgi:hypothetical protein
MLPSNIQEKQQEEVMASSMFSSTAVVTSPAQATMVAPFTGLKSSASFPVTRKANNDITSNTSNGGRVSCMKVNVINENCLLSCAISATEQYFRIIGNSNL